MPNPLDYVTEDQREQPGPARVFIYPSSDRLTGTDATTPSDASGNALTQAVAPPPQPFDLMQGLAQLAELVKNYGAGILDQTGVAGMEPGPRRDAAVTGRNSLVGVGNDQDMLWPQRMVKSGATLAGDVASGALPLLPPGLRREDFTDDPGPQGPTADSPWLGRKLGLRPGVTGPNQELIDRTQDMAGLAGGGALTERPGGATLGSGPVRPGARMPELKPASPGQKLYTWDSMQEGVSPLPKRDSLSQNPKLFEEQSNYGWKHDGVKDGVAQYSISGDHSHGGHSILETYASSPEEAAANFRKARSSSRVTGSVRLNSDTSEPGAAIAGAASAGPAPVFYSALEHAATNAAQDTMSPQQWLGFLKNTPGVKAEELAWTGLPEWLGAQKGKVKKEDVQAYLDEHKVGIKDVTKESGAPPPERKIEDVRRQAEQELKDVYGDEWRGFSARERRDMIDEHVEGLQGEFAPEDATKYSSYQLPGGENYREHLLTLPPRDAAMKARFDELTAKKTLTAAEEEEHNLLNQRVNYRNSPEALPEPYRSSHWDEPNVLAHVRTNDRTIDGQKSLHIEEIQSDWHQQGRKQGYTDPEAIKTAEKAAVDAKDAYDAYIKANHPNVPERTRQNMMAQFRTEANSGGGPLLLDQLERGYGKDARDLAQTVIDTHRAASDAKNSSKVPDAPFKTTWPELALKRMIRHAAENGYDRISWTPGEAQAARYDLSKHVTEMVVVKHADGGTTWWPKNTTGQGMGSITTDASGKIVKAHADWRNRGAVGKNIDEVVGKDVAKRGMESKDKETKLTGTDLKVGGEGMREFYDKMLPKMAEKIGKAHGVKVKRTNVAQSYEAVDPKGNVVAAAPTKTEIDAWIQRMNHANKDLGVGEFSSREVGQPVHYFDLPPSLKEHAIGKGFPLYMSGIPFPLTPVDYDPFKKKDK